MVAAKYDYDSDRGDKTNLSPNRGPTESSIIPQPSKPIQNNTFDFLNPINTGLFDTSNPSGHSTTVKYDFIKPVQGIFSMDTTSGPEDSNDNPNFQQNHFQHQPNKNNAVYSDSNLQNRPTVTDYIPVTQSSKVTPQTINTQIKTVKPQMTDQNENKDYSQNLSIYFPQTTTKSTTTVIPTTRTTQSTTVKTQPPTTTATQTTLTTTVTHPSSTTRQSRHFFTFFPTTISTSTTIQTLPVSVFKPPQYPLPVFEKERETTQAPSGISGRNKSNNENDATINIQQRPAPTTPQTLQSSQDVVSNRCKTFLPM